MEKNFERVRSLRDIIISVIMTAAGIACVVMPTSVSVNIFGMCLAVPGVLMFMFMKTEYKDAETGEHFCRRIKYYPASRKAVILESLGGDPSKSDWKEDAAASGLMLDVYSGVASDKVYVRVLEFIPYSYQPCSGWFSYDKAHAGGLVK